MIPPGLVKVPLPAVELSSKMSTALLVKVAIACRRAVGEVHVATIVGEGGIARGRGVPERYVGSIVSEGS